CRVFEPFEEPAGKAAWRQGARLAGPLAQRLARHPLPTLRGLPQTAQGPLQQPGELRLSRSGWTWTGRTGPGGDPAGQVGVHGGGSRDGVPVLAGLLQEAVAFHGALTAANPVTLKIGPPRWVARQPLADVLVGRDLHGQLHQLGMSDLLSAE